jgi:two-component system, OmpR family, KDP operon response regulator KdpE
VTSGNGNVLVVEDNASLRRTLRNTLAALNFDVGEASTGEEALRSLRTAGYDMVLLDINMPGMGGIETCKRIRKTYTRLPILMLTVRESEDDKVHALESGADDYVTKPFQIGELTARMRSAIRRYRALDAVSDKPLTVGEFVLDRVSRTVAKAGTPVHLTSREFGVLEMLMENAGAPLTHAQLLSSLSGPHTAENREYLRVLINNLRRKIESNPSAPEYLLTESYFGYRFREK